MGADENKTYWSSSEPNFKAYPSLKSSEKAEVVIVGGGINGCLTSYYLSAYNIETILIEKGSIAHSNTSKSPFALQFGAGRMLTDLTKKISRVDAERLFSLEQKSVDETEHILWELGKLSEFERKDSIIITDDLFELQHLKEEYSYRKSRSLDVSFLDEGELKRRYNINGVGAITQSRCAQLNPFKFSHILLKASASYGCHIYENTELLSFEYLKNGKFKIITPNADIECNKIVFTAGTDIKHLLHYEKIYLKSFIGFVTSRIDKEDNMLNSCILNTADRNRLTLRTTDDNRLIGTMINDSLKSQDEIYEIMIKIYPQFSQLNIDYYYDGIYGESVSNIPFIGRYKDYPGCYFNIGIGKDSETYGITGAQIIKDLILYKNCPDEKIFKIKK